MTQYPPKTFFLPRIFQAIEVVLQNTRIQTRGPNAGGGGYFHDTTLRTQQPKQYLKNVIRQGNVQLYLQHTIP